MEGTQKKMRKSVKKAWIEALTNGEYKQGQTQLRDVRAGGEDKFCCLGVLCDLYRKTRKRGRWVGNSFVLTDGTDRRYYSTLPPVEVVKWAGLRNSNPYIGGLNLAGFNDRGLSFSGIAEIIRENL